MGRPRVVRRGVLILAGLAAVLSGCSPHAAEAPTRPAATSTLAALPPVDCESSIKTGPLPSWARDGFTGDGSSYRHVEGLRDTVVGIVFGYPLTSPPRPSRENKILWVARSPTSGRLTIEAQLDGTGPVISREVGFGGGQSIVDLPASGCWRMTLRWNEGLTDTVDLPYRQRR